MAEAAALRVEGLKSSIRALGLVDRDLSKAAVKVMRDAAKEIKVAAQGKLQDRGGTDATYPRRRGMIRSGATQGGGWAGLSDARYPWAAGAEWGGETHVVFGRRTRQELMRRRTLGPWRGNQFKVVGTSGPGYLVQPTIREKLPRIERKVGEEIDDLYAEAFRRVGKE